MVTNRKKDSVVENLDLLTMLEKNSWGNLGSFCNSLLERLCRLLDGESGYIKLFSNEGPLVYSYIRPRSPVVEFSTDIVKKVEKVIFPAMSKADVFKNRNFSNSFSALDYYPAGCSYFPLYLKVLLSQSSYPIRRGGIGRYLFPLFFLCSASPTRLLEHQNRNRHQVYVVFPIWEAA